MERDLHRAERSESMDSDEVDDVDECMLYEWLQV
jgi:hypothetical protein